MSLRHVSRPMAHARWVAASDVAVEDEVLGVVDELEDFELGAVPVGRRF